MASVVLCEPCVVLARFLLAVRLLLRPVIEASGYRDCKHGGPLTQCYKRRGVLCQMWVREEEAWDELVRLLPLESDNDGEVIPGAFNLLPSFLARPCGSCTPSQVTLQPICTLCYTYYTK